MNINKWIKLNTYDLANKTIAITGSTGGIIKQVVKYLAQLNANFIFINRNIAKTEQQINELTSTYPNIKIKFIQCDLANFSQVKSTVDILLNEHIDILYLAAGVYNVKRFKTDLGYDNVFQTNFVSHYYIVKQLLSNIKAANGKVIAVSSLAHNYSKIDINDIDFTNQTKHSKVYGNAKRFLTYALQELAKQEDFNLSIVHPGLTLTNMTNHYPKYINWLVKVFIGLFCPSVKKASLHLLKGVFDTTSYHEWIGPKLLQVYGKPKKIKLTTCHKDESNTIFKIAENIFNEIEKT